MPNCARGFAAKADSPIGHMPPRHQVQNGQSEYEPGMWEPRGPLQPQQNGESGFEFDRGGGWQCNIKVCAGQEAGTEADYGQHPGITLVNFCFHDGSLGIQWK